MRRSTAHDASMTTHATLTVTEAQREQFAAEGYVVLESVLGAEQLEALRGECARLIAAKDAEMDALGVDTLKLNHRGSRYFLSGHSRESAPLRAFLRSPLMAEVCRATLGPDVLLFNEQYVVKAAERGMAFGWHQDSGYVTREHRPYLTCWITLDDVDERNGTVYLLPYSQAGTRDVVPHRHDEATNDMVGYFGREPGVPIIAPAGSIACFSSTVFHRSGANTTDRMRRVYVAQYSAEPIPDANPGTFTTPFLAGGRVVA